MRVRLLAVFLAASLGMAAHGDDEDVDLAELDFGELGLDDAFALLAEEDIVVSAAKRPQRISESASAITVLTRKQIAASGYDNLIDLMRLVPGADVMHAKQSHGVVGFRSGTTVAGDLTLVLVDGRDVAVPFFGQPLWMGMPFDIDSIERIEVIRGPGSTLYGANALQGVVNIVTRRPAAGPLHVEGKIDTAGGDYVRASARAHGTVGQFGYWASIGYLSAQPYTSGDHVALETFRARLRGDWYGDDDQAATVEIGYADQYGDLHTTVGAGRGGARWPYLRSWLKLGDTELQLSLDQTVAAMDLDFALALIDSAGEVIPVAVVGPLEQPTRSAELTTHHALDLFDGGLLTVGASAKVIHHRPGSIVLCDLANPKDFSQFDPDLCTPANVIETRLGIFGQFEWRPLENLFFTAGMRLDVNSLTPEPGLSPRLALVWKPTGDHALRVAFGRAYRKPTFIESHGHVLIEAVDGAPAELFPRLQHLLAAGAGNDQLKNEKSTQAELGWRGQFLDGDLETTLDLFVGRLDDSIMFDDSGLTLEDFAGLPVLPADAWLTYGNATKPGFSLGGEFSVGWRPLRWLKLSGFYQYEYGEELRTAIARDRRVPTTWEPDHRLGASMRVSSDAGFSLGLDWFWVSAYEGFIGDPESVLGERWLDPLGEVSLVNGSVRYRRAVSDDGFVEIGLAVFDLLDDQSREQPGVNLPDGRSFGGDRLGRRVRVQVTAVY